MRERLGGSHPFRDGCGLCAAADDPEASPQPQSLLRGRGLPSRPKTGRNGSLFRGRHPKSANTAHFPRIWFRPMSFSASTDRFWTAYNGVWSFVWARQRAVRSCQTERSIPPHAASGFPLCSVLFFRHAALAFPPCSVLFSPCGVLSFPMERSRSPHGMFWHLLASFHSRQIAV